MMLVGAHPFETFREIIDEELNRKSGRSRTRPN